MEVSGRKVQDTLSPTLSQGSCEDFELFCQRCDQDDLRLPAYGFCKDCEEHMCESCFNQHKRAKPSRQHILLDKHNMPQTLQVPSKSTHAGKPDDLTKPCLAHKKEMIKFYCHVHNALLCSVCVTHEHTQTSCKVNYIPDISKHIVNSTEYYKSLEVMDEVTEKCQKVTEDLKRMTTASNHSLTDVHEEIRKFRREINQRLDELEKEVEDLAKTLQEDNDARLKAAETCDDVTISLKALSEDIRQLNKLKDADTLFMELKRAEQLIKDNEKKISLLAPPSDVKPYHFQPNLTLSSFLLKGEPLGTLNSITRQDDVCVKTSEDQYKCMITGMVLLTPSKLILADRYNKSVKMTDLHYNSIIDQLQLVTEPWDITAVTNDQVAVTLQDEGAIQFISESSNKLKLKNRLRVDRTCSGISCYQKKLVVTFSSPSMLQIIDKKGKVIKTIATDSNGQDIFNVPYYVKSNSHSIYVSDAGKHAVLQLNWQGELIGSYGGMGLPEGIALLEDGSILVSDHDNGHIQHISGDLTKGSALLKDMKKPHAVCWNGTDNTLYVSSYSLRDINNDCIQVFQVSKCDVENYLQGKFDLEWGHFLP